MPDNHPTLPLPTPAECRQVYRDMHHQLESLCADLQDLVRGARQVEHETAQILTTLEQHLREDKRQAVRPSLHHAPTDAPQVTPRQARRPRPPVRPSPSSEATPAQWAVAAVISSVLICFLMLLSFAW